MVGLEDLEGLFQPQWFYAHVHWHKQTRGRKQAGYSGLCTSMVQAATWGTGTQICCHEWLLDVNEPPHWYPQACSFHSGRRSCSCGRAHIVLALLILQHFHPHLSSSRESVEPSSTDMPHLCRAERNYLLLWPAGSIPNAIQNTTGLCDKIYCWLIVTSLATRPFSERTAF